MTTVIVVVAIIVGSLVPWPFKVLLGMTGAAHAPIHIASFGVAAFLITEGSPRNARLWAWVGMVAVGIVIELMQWRLFKHAFEWLDLIYDTVGVVIALLARNSREASSYRPGAQ